MAVGARARIYFVNEGLNLASNFHPIRIPLGRWCTPKALPIR